MLFPTTLASRDSLRTILLAFVMAVWLLPALPLRAATGGSLSGTVRDPSGAVIPGAILRLINTGQQIDYQSVSDNQGLYSFPNLPVGHYELTVSASGFATQRKLALAVDADSAHQVDLTLSVAIHSDTVAVTTSSGVQAETIATHLGEVISGAEMTALPLNGRSYTDLLAIQPGVAPISTLLPSSVIMAGVTGASIPPGISILAISPSTASVNPLTGSWSTESMCRST